MTGIVSVHARPDENITSYQVASRAGRRAWFCTRPREIVNKSLGSCKLLLSLDSIHNAIAICLVLHRIKVNLRCSMVLANR